MNHGGRRSGSTTSPFIVSGVWKGVLDQRETVTRPTACPFCGDPVYFFRDLNGGSTFFDELGPPWPKHPCFDNSGQAAPKIRTTGTPPTDQNISVWELRRARELKKDRDLLCRTLAQFDVKSSSVTLFECVDSGTQFYMCDPDHQGEMGALGFLRPDDAVGQFSFRPALREHGNPKTYFGPCFACFEANVWMGHTVGGDDSILIASEISEGRARNLAGFFFRPEWRVALRIYVNACLKNFDLDLLERTAVLFSGPATGVLTTRSRSAITRLLRMLKRATSEEKLAIYDEILDELAS